MAEEGSPPAKPSLPLAHGGGGAPPPLPQPRAAADSIDIDALLTDLLDMKGATPCYRYLPVLFLPMQPCVLFAL